MKAFQKGKTRSSSWNVLLPLAQQAWGKVSLRSESRSHQNTHIGMFSVQHLSPAELKVELAHICLICPYTSSSSSSLVGGLSDCCPPTHTNTPAFTQTTWTYTSFFFLFFPHARALSCKKVLLLSLLDIKIEIVDYFFFVRV